MMNGKPSAAGELVTIGVGGFGACPASKRLVFPIDAAANSSRLLDTPFEVVNFETAAEAEPSEISSNSSSRSPSVKRSPKRTAVARRRGTASTISAPSSSTPTPQATHAFTGQSSTTSRTSVVPSCDGSHSKRQSPSCLEPLMESNSVKKMSPGNPNSLEAPTNTMKDRGSPVEGASTPVGEAVSAFVGGLETSSVGRKS
mmetsp:Transcript_9723/g.17129  ORF Transcript_9723/g.17129 Transcript_9723/m.17129 type:complete len:200 (-) Transcript_9723:629-1228(-)